MFHLSRSPCLSTSRKGAEGVLELLDDAQAHRGRHEQQVRTDEDDPFAIVPDDECPGVESRVNAARSLFRFREPHHAELSGGAGDVVYAGADEETIVWGC